MDAREYGKLGGRPSKVKAVRSAMLAVLDSGVFVNYTSHAHVLMPSVLAPADSPTEDQFTLASVAVEFETNLRSAFDEAADESAADADAQPAAGGAGAGAKEGGAHP